MCLCPWVHFLSFWSLFLWVEDHVKFFSKNSCWICLMYRMMKCHPALRFCSTHHRSKSFAGSLLPTKELHEQNMGKCKSSSHFSDTIFMRVVLVSSWKMLKMLQVGESGPNDHPIPIISRSRCLAILWTGRRWCGVVVTTGWSTSFKTGEMCDSTINQLPSGKLLHSYGKSPFRMGKSTISMVIFNSYVKLPEGISNYSISTQHQSLD